MEQANGICQLIETSSMLAECRLPDGRLYFSAESGNEFGMFLRAQINAAGYQVNFPEIPGYQGVVNPLRFTLAAHALTNQVADAIVTNVDTVSHCLLLSFRCDHLYKLYKYSRLFYG